MDTFMTAPLPLVQPPGAVRMILYGETLSMGTSAGVASPSAIAQTGKRAVSSRNIAIPSGKTRLRIVIIIHHLLIRQRHRGI